MKNEIIFKSLIDNYNKLSFTHDYIFGFADRGTIYCAIAKSDVLPFVLTLDCASRGCGYSLRFKPTIAQKEILKSCEIFTLCSEEIFTEEVKNSKYNRGEIFEKLVAEWFGQKWEKDNIPFTESGDLKVNGIDYQIKFEKASFISEKGLQNFRSRLNS